VDTWIGMASPNATHGTATSLSVAKSASQALIRFEDFFGTDPGQIAPTAEIRGAKLVCTTQSETAANISAYRMLSPWGSQSTYASLGNGVHTNGILAASNPDDLTTPSFPTTGAVFDVLSSILAWQEGETNFGWALLGATSGQWTFNASESASYRPFLDISYTASMVGFETTQVNAPPGAKEVTLTIHRQGLTPGAVSVIMPLLQVRRRRETTCLRAE